MLKLAERNLVRQRQLAAQKLIAANSLDSFIAERDSRAARIILAATFSRRCADRYVFLFCHDYSSLQTYSDRSRSLEFNL